MVQLSLFLIFFFFFFFFFSFCRQLSGEETIQIESRYFFLCSHMSYHLVRQSSTLTLLFFFVLIIDGSAQQFGGRVGRL